MSDRASDSACVRELLDKPIDPQSELRLAIAHISRQYRPGLPASSHPPHVCCCSPIHAHYRYDITSYEQVRFLQLIHAVLKMKNWKMQDLWGGPKNDTFLVGPILVSSLVRSFIHSFIHSFLYCNKCQTHSPLHMTKNYYDYVTR